VGREAPWGEHCSSQDSMDCGGVYTELALNSEMEIPAICMSRFASRIGAAISPWDDYD